MIYRPNPESLAARVIGFFALNPDQELSLDDIVTKFVDEGSSRNIHSQLIGALDADMLDYDPAANSYRRGPVSRASVLETPQEKAESDDGEPKSGFKQWLSKQGKTSAEALRKPATRAHASKKRLAPAMPDKHAIKDEPKGDFRPAQQATPFVTGEEHEMDRSRDIPASAAIRNDEGYGSGADPGADSLGGIEDGEHTEARWEAHSMDGAGEGNSPRTVSNESRVGDSPVAGQAGEANTRNGVCASLGENSTCQGGKSASAPASGLGEAEPARPDDAKGQGDGPLSPGLETGGHTDLGSGQRPSTQGKDRDNHRFSAASDSGQLTPGGSGRPREEEQSGLELSPRGGGTHPPEGSHNAPSEQVGQGASGGMINIVRQHLLDTLAALRDPNAPMPIERAKAIAEVSTVLVNSAKVEVDYLKVTQQRRGSFFEALPAPGGTP